MTHAQFREIKGAKSDTNLMLINMFIIILNYHQTTTFLSESYLIKVEIIQKTNYVIYGVEFKSKC